MFDTSDISLEALEEALLDRQAAINRLHAEQVVLLRALDVGGSGR